MKLDTPILGGTQHVDVVGHQVPSIISTEAMYLPRLRRPANLDWLISVCASFGVNRWLASLRSTVCLVCKTAASALIRLEHPIVSRLAAF